MSSVSSAWKVISKRFRNATAHKQSLPQAVVGVAHDIEALVELMNDGYKPASDRVAAAGMVRASLENDAVSSIPEIWYAVRALLNMENQAEIRRAGWKLMMSCIQHDEINVGAFNTYYHTLIDHSNVEDFDLILDVLRDLTQDGRRLLRGQTAAYRLPTVLISWIQLLAIRSEEIHKNSSSGDVAVQWGTSTPENFHSLLQYAVNVLKFNMSFFEETDLRDILLCAAAVMRDSKEVAQIENLELCCTMIDTIMAYGILPLPVLQEILEVLCQLALMDNQLAEKSWKTVQNLCLSHLASSTVVVLTRILQPNAETSLSMRQGSARLLAKIVIRQTHQRHSETSSPALRPAALSVGPKVNHEPGIPEVPIRQVLTAYSGALEADTATGVIAIEISDCLYRILADEFSQKLLIYDIWQSAASSPLRLVYQLSYLVAQSTSPELHKQLGWRGGESDLISIQNASAKVSINLTQVFRKITSMLVEKDSNLPIEEVCFVCIELYRYLDEASAMTLIDVCSDTHFCAPYVDGWFTRVTHILTHIYQTENCSSSVRLKILKLVKDIYVWGTLEVGPSALANKENSLDDHSFFRAARDDAPSTQELGSVYSKDEFVLLTDKVFGILSQADLATAKELLNLFALIAQSKSPIMFDRITELILMQFPDQSQRQVTTNLHSEKCQACAEALGQLFVSTFQHDPEQSRKLYDALIQICKRSLHDSGPFSAAYAVLVRLRVRMDNAVMLTEPVIEGDYGLLADYQLPLPRIMSVVDQPSLVLKRSLPLFTNENQVTPETSVGISTIDSSPLLSLIMQVLQVGGSDKTYALVLINLANQLSNVQLFTHCYGDLVNIRNLLLTQLNSGKLAIEKLKIEGVGKQDYFSIIIHVLTIMVCYGEIFQKSDSDKLVQTLFVYMNRNWDKGANWAIHCLILLCYECPTSVQRFLPQLLTKFQTKMTSKESSTHILEFILTVSMVSSLTDIFNFQEYKRVFGMCFTYIQDANYSLIRSKTDSDVNSKILSQYLLRLAYASINNLYLSIELSERRTFVPYLVRNLVLADGESETMTALSQITYDMMCRYTFSDLPLTLYSAVGHVQNDDSVDYRRWILGNVIFEYRTNVKTGSSWLVIRRPVGTMVLRFNPEFNVTKNNESTEEEIYSANFWLMSNQVQSLDQQPLPKPIPNDAQSQRTISTLDRAPVLDLHKAGVIYIAPGQTTEDAILSNTSGSLAYNQFLKGLGTLIRLKNNRDFYVGGLDTESDLDGKYAYGYHQKILQVIFHVTTMMPNREDDKARSSKKRHVGNNFVNIYFDESLSEFNFDIVKSQFNFINIVVSPTGLVGKWKVRAYRRAGLDNVLAAYELKTVSQEQLPQFVVHLAIKASQYATVYNQHGEYTDNWTWRLNLIQTLKQRLDAVEKEPEAENEDTLSVLQWLDMTKFTI